MLISVDFDGTCVTHEFPETGKNVGAEIVLRAFVKAGHKIICLSMRSNEHKDTVNIDTIKAIKDWFKKERIKLYAINDNPAQTSFSNSRKVFAHIYIDDQFLGCPLTFNVQYSDRAFVDWFGVTYHLFVDGFLSGEETKEVMSELEETYPELYTEENCYRRGLKQLYKNFKKG